MLQSPCTIAKEVLESKTVLPQVKLVNVFHGTPGFEVVPLDWSIIRYRLLHNIERKWTLKQSVIQIGMALCPRMMTQMLRKKYARPYGVADKMVMLAKGNIDQYQSIAPADKDKFVVIPNILSFDPIEQNLSKAKEVLIVSRLDDWHKRILAALKIWALVQKSDSYRDWILRIVGDGVDRPFYEEYVRKHAIPNIVFEGRQKPLKYYLQAGIFMMTSVCEGFPMTLVEAQQCGCLPVAFDSFISVDDIIQSGRNGIIVPEKDEEEYARALERLMKNDVLRKELATNAQKDVLRFSRENIAKQWKTLLENL